MNKSEIAEKARKRFAFEQYAKTVTWNTYEGDDDPFAFFPESGVYANGDIQLAWLGWQWRERAIAESQAWPRKMRLHPALQQYSDSETHAKNDDCAKIGCVELGDGEPSPPPDANDQLDGQFFYELMQSYRHTPVVDQAGTIAAFEAIKKYIRANWIYRGAAQEVSPREPQLVEVPEPAWKPPEPDVIVVDRVPSVMNNAELTDLIHSAAHELFRRLEPKFYDRKE